MTELARRYAHALYGIFPDEGTLERTAGELMKDHALWESLCSPAVQAQEKERILARLPVLDGHRILLSFYSLLADKGRMALLPEVVKAFHEKALAERGAASCRMTCVREPEAEELEKLRKVLCHLHRKQDVVFDIHIQPDIIGGFLLEIEGVTYDKSVRGTLSGMFRQLEERRMA